MRAADIADDLWAFSLDRYARPGVREACLDLQDGFGGDVNVVLLGLWAGQNGFALSGADIEAILAAGAAAWQRDAVAPLRAARRTIKVWNAQRRDPEIAAFRDRVQALELEAERLAQRLLAAAFAERFAARASSGHSKASATATAMRNLSHYLERVAPGQSDAWAGNVETLASVCTD